jgi:type I restriction enzyme S subunit
MSEQTNITIVPKLRFPEFRDSKRWERKSLGDVATLFKGKGISKADIAQNGTLPCIRYGELYTHYNESITLVISYTNLPSNELILSQPNDVIIPASGETQEDIAKASCVINGGIALGGDLNVIRSKLNGVFLSYYLNNAKKKEISQLAQGNAVVHLSPSQLEKLDIDVPKLDEQQKIADCLSSIDEVITSQGQKLDTLKEHKKGLVQQLFPNEGENVSKLRFPEFQDAEKWCYVNGDILFDSITNKNHNSDLPLLAITQEHGAIPRNEIDYNVTVTDKSVESYKVVEVGDFIISLRSFQGGIEYSKYRGICSPAYIILRKKDNVVSNFFKHYFKTRIFIINLNKNIEGIRDGKMVSYKQFSDLLLPLPSPEEQLKIADCLSSIDDLITMQNQKIDALKTHKKGLMHQLLPTINND